ncbi:MAG: FG-GAP-like repeat-containing protein [Candidatus Cloacimonas sp.]|jgi:hypothetical protein|nr:FG-GAP-like repeat-containing protein [Candidatus Cloacimonas sp.]
MKAYMLIGMMLLIMLLHISYYAINNMELIAEFQGEHNNSGYGKMLVSLDFNHDSYLDLVVLSPFYGWAYNQSPSRGKVYVYYGGPSFSFSTPPAMTLEGEYPNGTGRYVGWIDNIDDVNGDGYDDLLIIDSLPGVSSSNRYMYYYGENPDLNSPDKIETVLSGQCIYEIYSIGDVDNDGFDDVGLGYTLNNIFMYDIQWGGTFERQVFLTGEGSVSYIGGIKRIGDINNDGYDDFSIGLVHDDEDGLYNIIRIYYGNQQRVFTNPLVLIQNYYGSRVSKALGDLNGDGYDDFLGYANEDGMRVWFGSDNLNPSQPSLILNPVYFGDEYMRGIGYGDLNNDGYDDAVGGNPYNRRFVVWMGGTAMNGSTDMQKINNLESFGYSLAMGDYNGDGCCDIAISAPKEYGEWPGHNFLGYVFVYGGNSSMVANDDLLAPALSEQLQLSISPNPLRSGSAISIRIKQPQANGSQPAQIEIYNIKGQRLYRSEELVMNSAEISTRITLPSLASGIYLCKVKVGDKEKISKLSVIK